MNLQLEPILSEIEKAVVGKRGVIEKILMALLAEGHILLDDVPGVGKTTLAVALSRALGLDFSRIQFTPDVLPSDIVGFSVYDRQSGEFVYRPGAVTNANLLLGDDLQGRKDHIATNGFWATRSTAHPAKHNPPFWKRWKSDRLP